MTEQRDETKEPRGRTITGTIASAIGIILALAYILNPTAGVIELIPDNLPIIGNIDEAGATWLIIVCLRYLGLDIGGIMQRSREQKKAHQSPTQE